jgi:hypothetical protein
LGVPTWRFGIGLPQSALSSGANPGITAIRTLTRSASIPFSLRAVAIGLRAFELISLLFVRLGKHYQGLVAA